MSNKQPLLFTSASKQIHSYYLSNFDNVISWVWFDVVWAEKFIKLAMYLKKNNNNLKIHRSSSHLCTQSICLRILKGMRPDLVETPVSFEFSFIRLVFKGIRPDLVETLVSFEFSFIRLVFAFKSFFPFLITLATATTISLAWILFTLTKVVQWNHVNTTTFGPWKFGRMAGWSYGGVVVWRGGRMAGRSYGGAVVWRGGRMAGWSYGGVVVWRGGRMAGWSYGGVVVWRGGRMAGWSYGGVVVWRGGRMAGWSYGGVVVWRGGRMAGWSY